MKKTNRKPFCYGIAGGLMAAVLLAGQMSVLAEEAVKAALFDYYNRHPELEKPEGLPDCAECHGGCCSCS